MTGAKPKAAKTPVGKPAARSKMLSTIASSRQMGSAPRYQRLNSAAMKMPLKNCQDNNSKKADRQITSFGDPSRSHTTNETTVPPKRMDCTQKSVRMILRWFMLKIYINCSKSANFLISKILQTIYRLMILIFSIGNLFIFTFFSKYSPQIKNGTELSGKNVILS